MNRNGTYEYAVKWTDSFGINRDEMVRQDEGGWGSRSLLLMHTAKPSAAGVQNTLLNQLLQELHHLFADFYILGLYYEPWLPHLLGFLVPGGESFQVLAHERRFLHRLGRKL